LQGFIYAQRTLTACYVSLKRLYINHNSFDFLSDIFTNSDENKKSKQKQWVIELKNKLKTISSIGKT
ncbi:tRNA cytosine(34) acetyltransferase TmcA, partial [Glaesserella parasuis]|nr:tRNA cytosine(34) acetyltransferase TmcA [Glaesserella parasuis]